VTLISDRLLTVAGLIVIAGGGNWILRRRLLTLQELKYRAVEFHNKLGEYLESGGRDSSGYQWLTLRAVRMQEELGSYGVMGKFRPPFANYLVSNWPIVLNSLPEIHQSLSDSILFNQAASYAQILKDALIRYIGVLDYKIEMAGKETKNPIMSFREGVQAILRIPIFLLYWLGLRPAPSLSGSRVSRAIAGLIAVLSLASAVVSLAVGWSPFVKLLRSVL
jgi:hypothetical protein